MRIGIAYDLRPADGGPERRPDGRSGVRADERPDDVHEEYDSPATIAAIEAALRELGHETVLLGGGRALVGALLSAPPELVFNIAEGREGTRSREAHVPALCEMLALPFTHSDPLTLALTLDKAMAKRVVAACGVRTPAFVVVPAADDPALADCPLPAIVKPLFEGSSMGVRLCSRVETQGQLREQVQRVAAGYGQPALVEAFCPGTELTVGILGTGAGAQVLGVMEIAPRHLPLERFVYSIEVKRDWRNQVEYHVPPRASRAVVEDVERTALAAYRALGCQDVGRVDLRLDAQGRACFLEVNPLPGLNPETGDLPILCAHSGLGYQQLIGRIVAAACRRNGLKA